MFRFYCVVRPAEGVVTPQHPLWRLAVDSILVKLVDSETQVGGLAPFACFLLLFAILFIRFFP